MNSITQWAALLLCVVWTGGWAQSRQVVCDRGHGSFEASAFNEATTRVPNDLTVRVGAVASGGFATRSCEAVLRWGKNRKVMVEAAAQLDIDVFGADLGFGVPVVAFFIRLTEDDWRGNYEVWSIEKKPRLLLRLTGEDSYRAVDAEFNRQVAVWTTDAAAVEGFEGLTHADYAFPPTMVLQFEHGRMMDVSARYREEYDRQIGTLREGLTADELAKFRRSDVEFKPDSVSVADWLRLRKTKAAVLEIVWAYLYSGRPERAWAELEDVWPIGDLARVRAAIDGVRARGLEARVARLASSTRPPSWLERPLVYEYVKPSGAQDQNSGQLTYGAPGVTGSEGPVLVSGLKPSPSLYEADTEPRPISLWRPPRSSAEQTSLEGEETVLLIIDEAGKVQSVKMDAPKIDPKLLQAAKDWNFIPASRDRRPVAYRLRLDVRLLR